MQHSTDPFAYTESTANRWLAVVRARLAAEDPYTAYRMLRAWLHVVRDRLTVEAAMHFAAQLPELLRGVYYEGRTPSYVPTRYEVPGFIARFAGSAAITRQQVPAVAAAVTSALGELCPPCQLEHVLGLLPDSLVELLTSDEGTRHAS